jgi:hypothetical protein
LKFLTFTSLRLVWRFASNIFAAEAESPAGQFILPRAEADSHKARRFNFWYGIPVLFMDT